MVRLKHRYLLVHLLYPEESELKKGQQQTGRLPDFVQFHRPTSDNLTPQALARLIKDQIALLFGDYGVGVTSGNLNGMCTTGSPGSFTDDTLPSQIPLSSNLNSYHQVSTRSLSLCLGSSDFHNGATKNETNTASPMCISGGQGVGDDQEE